MGAPIADRGKIPLVAILGLAWIAGGAVLAWLSASATLTLERRPDGLRATVERHLLGFIPAGTESVGGIRSIESVSGRLDTSSHTPNQLVFVTTGGATRQGYDVQRFLSDYPDIRDFVADPARATFVRSTTHRGNEMMRFVFAQAIAAFLVMVGALFLWAVVRTILPSRDA